MTSKSSDNATISAGSLTDGQTMGGATAGMKFVMPPDTGHTLLASAETKLAAALGKLWQDFHHHSTSTTDTTPKMPPTMSGMPGMHDWIPPSATGSSDSKGSGTKGAGGGHTWMDHNGSDAGTTAVYQPS